MFLIKKNNLKCFGLVVFISLICSANARQYSRYNTEVTDDSVENQNRTYTVENKTDDETEVEAIVREIKLGPYPANGYRPSKAFSLPNIQGEIESQVTDESTTTITSTTETIGFTTNTHGYESETTTINNIEEVLTNENDGKRIQNVSEEFEKSMAPYPPVGFQPKIPFLLPTKNMLNSEQEKGHNLTNTPSEVTNELQSETELKAPYPAAGYRPSIPFLLPSAQLQLKDETTGDINSKTDNSNHPVCGSSTNPLSPKPVDGEKPDPDSEPIGMNTKTKKISQPQRDVIPKRLTVHSLLITRPRNYNSPIPSSW